MASVTQKPFGLRMPDDVKAWITYRAESNGRSLNSEIIQLIKAERERSDLRSNPDG